MFYKGFGNIKENLMMKAQKNPIFTGVMILMVSGFMISCTKEVPYKQEYKEKVHAKSEIDEKSEYIYVASSDLTNHDDLGASGASPYWQGNEKIVKFRFTETTLQAVQVDDESRLQDNATNNKVVFEIPIENVDYRCAPDKYGKCTNQEEENREVTWNKKTKFKPNFEGMKTVGVSLLPVEMDQVFGTSCYKETASQFLNYTLTEDALNIQVQKVFEGDMNCLEKKNIQITSLSDLQSQIIYHYSFAKMKTLANPSYKPVSYSVGDENEFGFFTTETKKYDVAFNRIEKMKSQFMNRWNPERKTIDYYLTDNFDKPEYAAIRKATQTAFDRVNAGLKSAGVDLKLNLKGTDHKSPGDIRNSMIVLVEDPVVAGPLGYGPSVANPRTGEIMSARVAMYYGNLLTGVKSTYDEVVREVRRNKGQLDAAKSAPQLSDNLKHAHMSPALKAAASSKDAVKLDHAKTLWSRVREVKARKANQAAAKNLAQNSSAAVKLNFSPKDLHTLSQRQVERMMLRSDNTSVGKDALSAMSKYCNYPSELFNFNEAVKTGLQSKLGQDLKLWKDLNETEKGEVIALIAPEIWIPTLVHELGHNLGLRHNFGGSEDKENFYTAEELNKMGIKHKVPYSSVMDYGYSELNVLPTLGKYDIAALRFGYKREVEAKNGKMVELGNNQTLAQLKSLDTTLADLKEYRYCTDGHVDVNPGCKRFDEGTTTPEIMDFLEKSYEEMYSVRNFRNGRENFSKMSDIAYANRMRANFGYIRAFMERYESMKYMFKLTDDAPEWNSIPWVKDVKTAALKSGQFFLKVLQTPDIHCAIAKADAPNEITQIVELSLIDPNGISCFKDIKPKTGFIVVGQAGKAFNHKKDSESENAYADQIDVRGIFVDKIVAAEKLFARKTGNSSFDKYEDSYTDMPEMFSPIMLSMRDLLMNDSTPVMAFKNELGNELGSFKYPSRVFSPPQDEKTISLAHWLEAPLDESIGKALGVPMRQASFQEVLLNTIVKSSTESQARAADDRNFLDMFTIVKTNKSFQLDPKLEAPTRDIGVTRLVALKDNAFATMSIKTANLYDKLKKLSNEQVAKLYAYAKAKEDREKADTANASSFNKDLKAISVADIAAFTKSKGQVPADKVGPFGLLNQLSGDEIARLYNENLQTEAEMKALAATEELANASFPKDVLDIHSSDIQAYAQDNLDGPLNEYLATILPASNAL